MYQRALQGYENTISIDTNVPALNTISTLGLLFEHQANIAKARTIYSKAFIGNKILVSSLLNASESQVPC